MKYRTFVTAISLVASVNAFSADSSGLSWFDPGKPALGNIQAPGKPVNLTIDSHRKTIAIDRHFYGINIHPIKAEEAFRNSGLLRILKPDSIRVMLTKRTSWVKVNGKTKVLREELYPRPGVFDWKEIDALVKGIEDVGAEPYITLGFGAPKYLNTAKGKKFGLPLTKDIEQYGRLKAEIAQHLKRKKIKSSYICLENEPENVKYPFSDYLLLCKKTIPKIHMALPEIKIAGPATGYGSWKQPAGPPINFFEGHRRLLKTGIEFDAIDLHIYTGNPQRIFNTITKLHKIYGPKKPIIISELNLDWRYSGKGGTKSQASNTSWLSALWLTSTADGLQRLGVRRIYYFCLRNNFFGMYDYWFNEVRPAYYIFWMLTTQLGRQRVSARTDHPSVKVIATKTDNNHTVALIYNLSSGKIELNLKDSDFSPREFFTYSRNWYESNKKITEGKINLPKFSQLRKKQLLHIPPQGFILLKD